MTLAVVAAAIGSTSLTPAVRGQDALMTEPIRSATATVVRSATVLPKKARAADFSTDEVRPVISVPRPAPVMIPRQSGGSTAVFLGDSYTSGWLGVGIGADSWPRIVGANKGWRVVNLAVPGTGFKNPGWTNQPVLSRVALAIKLRPDVVVIAAGHNDSGWSQSSVATAGWLALHALHVRLPNALIVVVGPMWQDGNPPVWCRQLRDRLRGQTQRIGGVFIDPLAENWFGGDRHALIGSDGIHPTAAGYRFIARRFLEAFGA